MEAPVFDGYLNADFRDFFSRVRQGLDRLRIEYRLNSRLVRGLDYYSHTAFEFVTSDIGSAGNGNRRRALRRTIRSHGWPRDTGGRMGSGDRAAGHADRRAAAAAPASSAGPRGEAGESAALQLAEELRRGGFPIDLGYSGNLARRLRRANKIGARAAVLIGDSEIERGIVALRDLDSGAQAEVPVGELPSRLANLVD